MKQAYALLVALVALAPVYAQAPALPERVSIQVTQVLPEMLEAWQNTVKSEGIPGQKKAGVAWRQTYTKAPFGPSYTFVTMTPIVSFASYDQPSALTRGLGEDGLVKYFANLRPLVVSSNIAALTFERRASIVAGARTQASLLLVETLVPLPGRASDYVALVAAECLPLYAKAGIRNYWVYTGSLGASTIMTMRPLGGLSELDGPDPMRAALDEGLGAEAAARLRQRLDGLLAGVAATEVYRHIPELSFGDPAPAQTQ